MARFKVGDRVRIVKKADQSVTIDKTHHIGKIYTITSVGERQPYPYGLNSTSYLWCDEELELASFTKADLKDGMVVEFRDGREKYLVLNGQFRGKREWMPIDGYQDDLINRPKTFMSHHYDVVKVYESTSSIMDEYFDERNLNLIWERKAEEPKHKEMTVAEIEEKLGYKIKVIADKE